MGQAIEFVKHARELGPSSVDLIRTSAEINTLSNKPEAALADLKKGLQQGLTTTSIASDPEFESVRKRADYQTLMNQIRLKEEVGFGDSVSPKFLDSPLSNPGE